MEIHVIFHVKLNLCIQVERNLHSIGNIHRRNLEAAGYSSLPGEKTSMNLLSSDFDSLGKRSIFAVKWYGAA